MDKIDHEILSALYRDGRLTNIELAQKLGINKATVARKKEKMLAERLCVIRAVPNPFKIINKARAFIALSVDLKKVKNVCTKLAGNPRISAVITTFGDFNVFLYMEFPEWDLLTENIKREISTLEGLNDIEINLVSEVRRGNWHFFEPEPDADSEPPALDKIDHKLIEELSENGCVKYPYLAKLLGISSATISRRITSLISRNIIKIVAVPNPAQLDSHFSAVIKVNIERSKLNQICTELFRYNGVHTIMVSISSLEVFIRAYFPTSGQMHEFISERLVYIDGVMKVKPYVRAEINKILYSPDIKSGIPR